MVDEAEIEASLRFCSDCAGHDAHEQCEGLSYRAIETIIDLYRKIDVLEARIKVLEQKLVL